MIVMNLVTLQAAAGHDLLSSKHLEEILLNSQVSFKQDSKI